MSGRTTSFGRLDVGDEFWLVTKRKYGSNLYLKIDDEMAFDRYQRCKVDFAPDKRVILIPLSTLGESRQREAKR